MKLLTNLKESKVIMINILWANAYTDYLNNKSDKMNKIDNNYLKF
jgi:hypothetical protein